MFKRTITLTKEQHESLKKNQEQREKLLADFAETLTSTQALFQPKKEIFSSTATTISNSVNKLVIK